MKRVIVSILILTFTIFPPRTLLADLAETEYSIFDDKTLILGYTEKYAEKSKDVLLAMIKDEELTSYMCAAAIRAFREKYSSEIFGAEKKAVEKILLRRLARADSSFIELEIMQTLCLMDRYKYFESMVPGLIQLLDHYNETVSEWAFEGINEIIKGQKRAREARIVFNTLRKKLFLSRKKYENIKEPGPKLKQKLSLLRWAIKILGTQELQRLPSEIIDFL